MTNKLVLAVDIGTTGVKTLAVDAEGNVRFSHSIAYPLYFPRADYAEQDPDEMLSAAGRCVRTVMEGAVLRPEDVLCLSFSSAMHGLIAMDGSGQPLTRCITWADQRGAEQADRLKRDGSGLDVYLRTGAPIHPMTPLVKLLWMREQQPHLFARARYWIGIKEYVLYRLFGCYVSDYSVASGTGLFNFSSLGWDAGAMALAGIREDQLPRLVPATHRLTGMDARLAADWGIRPATPVVVGASDGALANLGMGAVGDGRLAVTIGTSSAVRAAMDHPVTDPDGRLFCFALTEDCWMIGGASNNGGVITQWAADRWFPDRTLDEVLPLAGSVPAGSDGLLFLPLLTGERAPFWNASAKGVMFGLTLSHTERHMLRAAMEGVSFQIRAIAELVKAAIGAPQEIRASGGFAKSPLWCQIMADMLGTTLQIPSVIESSGLGAAAMGYYAMAGGRGKLVQWAVRDRVAFEPDERNHRIYSELLPLYLRVYENLAESMKELSGFQARTRG